MSSLNISSEEYRVYHYRDGSYRIESPVELYKHDGSSGMTHRVIDAAGLTHRPTPGWLGLSWKPRDGQPAFVA